MRLFLAVIVTLSSFAFAAPEAKATLRAADGRTVGVAALSTVKGGVRVIVTVTGIEPGNHAFHVHTVGACVAPTFESAGGHFNPGAHEHGLENPKGAHMGDMPNVVVNAGGVGSVSFLVRGATLGTAAGSLFPAGGTALVLHAAPDDMKTDPSGNAGARIACGVIERGASAK